MCWGSDNTKTVSIANAPVLNANGNYTSTQPGDPTQKRDPLGGILAQAGQFSFAPVPKIGMQGFKNTDTTAPPTSAFANPANQKTDPRNAAASGTLYPYSPAFGPRIGR